MVTADELAQRQALIKGSDDLTSLLNRLVERAAPVRDRMPLIPSLKALLSSDGGVCPADRSPLIFDPWSPSEHRCSACGKSVTGPRHDRHWAKYQHLWLAERASHLATVGVLADDAAAAARAKEILAGYESRYFELPNRDNVLGPSHLFFSTYLESIWLLNFIAAATLLRESGRLDETLSGTIDRIVDEAANVIGEFNEGFSNRQTWHAAALTAVASWFGDEELARSSIEGRTGLLGHLADGFGDDGTWFEGENYHLFALRGLLTGLGWARSLGADLLDDPEIAAHLRLALLAPARTALPDFTFPARKDSRFGVSLSQPMYLEIWEAGLGMLGGQDEELASWLAALYAQPAQPALPFESYLHESAEPASAKRGRQDLSWWSLLTMSPELSSTASWVAESRYFASQGLGVIRQGKRYVSLECGGHGGGHGHPDRLHLTLHDGGVHWLPDFGTGSYVSRDLFWYRSTLAHNAPFLDGLSQPPGDAVSEMFEARGDWGWMRGRFGRSTRTVVVGPGYLLDVVTADNAESRRLDLPWHFAGEAQLETPGEWRSVEPDTLADEFVHDVERFVTQAPGPFSLRLTTGGSHCRVRFLVDGDLLRARGPGAPGTGEATFFVCRGQGALVRVVTVLDLSPGETVRDVRTEGDEVVIEHAGSDRHTPLLEGWQVTTTGGVTRLAGVVKPLIRPEPILSRPLIERAHGTATWIGEAPLLDGTGAGFEMTDPLNLDTELQYRRSEEPYAGPESFSATATLNWSDEELFLLLEVAKADVWFRPESAPPLGLDNEVDGIHSDGLQVYLGQGETTAGFLIVPAADGGLRVSAAGGNEGDPSMVRGGWSMTGEGYRVTLGIRPGWVLEATEPLEFDLLINEMRPGRQRRAGQLVWSGGNGWVYLRGDRQDAASFGVIRLT